MTRRMDRSRPLWEYWFCEGLADGRWALLSKIHHSMVDGVSGTDLYRLVLDPTAEPGDAGPRRLAARASAPARPLRRGGGLAPGQLAGRCRLGPWSVAGRTANLAGVDARVRARVHSR